MLCRTIVNMDRLQEIIERLIDALLDTAIRLNDIVESKHAHTHIQLSAEEIYERRSNDKVFQARYDEDEIDDVKFEKQQLPPHYTTCCM